MSLTLNIEGDDSAYGLALYPIPSDDPNDPLQWPRWKKLTILALVSLYSFFANGALFGPSVYVNYTAAIFKTTPNVTSRLVTYPNLAFGYGSVVFVPLYHRYGRRPVMILSLVIFMVGLLGCALSDSYNTLMAFRVIQAFGSSVCEALPAQAVGDVFFLHERGNALGWYTFALASGPVAALIAGYMLNGGNSYKLFFWVYFAVAALLLICTVLFFEETMYFRKRRASTSGSDSNVGDVDGTKSETNIGSSERCEIGKESRESEGIPARKTWKQQLKIFSIVDKDTNMLMMAIRSFTYFAVPPVFWVCSTYGMVIGLAALAFTTTFPGIVAAPPYDWPLENTGLISVAALVGYAAAAILFGTLPDKFAAYKTRKNRGIREAEYRLWCLVPVFFVAPASLILYGYSAEKQLHWIGLVFGVGIFQFGSFFYMTYTLAYAMDSYESNVPEMLIAMNIGKQSISFGFGFKILDWIAQYGYIKVFAGIFTGVMTINNLAVVIFLVWGKSMRRWIGQTWLARMHRRSLRPE
ncbi:MFS general substrate transporter [Coniochaeta ligniaria NRRL 30616]|uniref:MFS general substrate transporter n=1 Tax=Coniochaeta ligniaria NRRL 30616 TaxID=1408157 RepID=A0A1J7IP03_9PEZI|nr:MFS general substrate transporter [Coniochaeta ligniaria NRRL 30616]